MLSRKKRKAQVAIEYMMIIGVVMLITIPTAFVFYNEAQKNADRLTAKQAGEFLNSVLKNADTIYYLGPPSRRTIKNRLPSGIVNLTVQRIKATVPGEKDAYLAEISFRTSRGVSTVSKPSPVPLYGFLDGNDLSEGVKKTVLEARGGRRHGHIVTVRTDLPVARVFVPHDNLKNPSTLTEADHFCTEKANDQGGPGGEWKAWRSTSTEDARDRIDDATYVRMDGLPIAVDKEDLTDGSILNFMNFTRDLEGIKSPFRLFTGTFPNGTHSGYSCLDWTSSDAGLNATTGRLTPPRNPTPERIRTALTRWTDETRGGTNFLSNWNCNRGTSRVYCFEKVGGR